MLLIHTVKSTEINLYYFYFADDELLKRLFIIHYLPILRALVLMEFLNFSKCRRMPWAIFNFTLRANFSVSPDV